MIRKKRKNLNKNLKIFLIKKYYQQHGKNCSEGCELYFLIESDEVTTEPSSLIEVSFSIDKKWSENENGISEMPLNKYVKGKVDGFLFRNYACTQYQSINETNNHKII